MIVQIVRVNFLAGVQMEFTMKSMGVRLALLEQFHPMCLLNPALKNASHTFHGGLSEFVGFATIVVDASEGGANESINMVNLV